MQGDSDRVIDELYEPRQSLVFPKKTVEEEAAYPHASDAPRQSVPTLNKSRTYYWPVNHMRSEMMDSGADWREGSGSSREVRAGVLSMKVDRYFWMVLSVLFCVVGAYVLFAGMRDAGTNADQYVLAGATLVALGLGTSLIAIEHYMEVRAMARHFGRGSHVSRRSRATRTEDHS